MLYHMYIMIHESVVRNYTINIRNVQWLYCLLRCKQPDARAFILGQLVKARQTRTCPRYLTKFLGYILSDRKNIRMVGWDQVYPRLLDSVRVMIGGTSQLYDNTSHAYLGDEIRIKENNIPAWRWDIFQRLREMRVTFDDVDSRESTYGDFQTWYVMNRRILKYIGYWGIPTGFSTIMELAINRGNVRLVHYLYTAYGIRPSSCDIAPLLFNRSLKMSDAVRLRTLRVVMRYWEYNDLPGIDKIVNIPGILMTIARTQYKLGRKRMGVFLIRITPSHVDFLRYMRYLNRHCDFFIYMDFLNRYDVIQQLINDKNIPHRLKILREIYKYSDIQYSAETMRLIAVNPNITDDEFVGIMNGYDMQCNCNGGRVGNECIVGIILDACVRYVHNIPYTQQDLGVERACLWRCLNFLRDKFIGVHITKTIDYVFFNGFVNAIHRDLTGLGLKPDLLEFYVSKDPRPHMLLRKLNRRADSPRVVFARQIVQQYCRNNSVAETGRKKHDCVIW